MNHLQQNIATIAKRDPALAAALRDVSPGVIEIRESRSGLPTASVAGRWLHSAYDPRREAEQWAREQATACKPGDSVVLFGVGLLYHAEALRTLLPAETSLVVVVPDLRELRDACDCRSLGLWAEQIQWVRGGPEDIADKLTASGKPLRILSASSPAALHAPAYGAIEQLLRQKLAAKAGGRLHVAFVGPIYGGSLPIARYAVTALESLGHRVTYIDHSVHATSYHSFTDLKEPRQRLTMQSKMADLLSHVTLARLAEDPPDLVLAMAQAPVTPALLEHLRRKRFLTAMWFVENHRHLRYWQQMATGYDYWFVIQKNECIDALRQAGARHVSYLPMAADPVLHRPMELTQDERAEFGSDLSFVGAGYPNRRAILPRLISPHWSFKVWGNEWDGADAMMPILQRGGARIDTETCLKVFTASAINLNLHSCTGQGLDPQADFVNPRAFELASCGAFQLSDQRSLLPELFSGDEIATFSSVEELPKLIAQWLREPEARRRMAQAAQRRVLAEHTYRHRMRDLLSHIGVGEPDRIGSLLNNDRCAGALAAAGGHSPVLSRLLGKFPAGQRVELKDVAALIRRRGAGATLERDELLLLMLDEYRSEVRDLA